MRPMRSSAPMHASSIEEIAVPPRSLPGSAARMPAASAVIGTARNVGTTYSAITLARALAEDGTVVLVDLAFGAPNLSVISTEPEAPGIADLIRGTVASFGDIITRDQYSNVNLVATGEVGNDAEALAASPMLATVIEALAQSYDHVVIDLGSAADVAGRVVRGAVAARRAGDRRCARSPRPAPRASGCRWRALPMSACARAAPRRQAA